MCAVVAGKRLYRKRLREHGISPCFFEFPLPLRNMARCAASIDGSGGSVFLGPDKGVGGSARRADPPRDGAGAGDAGHGAVVHLGALLSLTLPCSTIIRF